MLWTRWRARTATPWQTYCPYASKPSLARPIKGNILKNLVTRAPSPSSTAFSNSRRNRRHRLSAALSRVCAGNSGTSAVGTFSSAKALSTTSLGIREARCMYSAAVSQSCGAPIDPTTPSTHDFNSDTCSTTANVALTRSCSVSSFETAVESFEAVLAAPLRCPWLRARVLLERVPSRARVRSSRAI